MKHRRHIKYFKPHKIKHLNNHSRQVKRVKHFKCGWIITWNVTTWSKFDIYSPHTIYNATWTYGNTSKLSHPLLLNFVSHDYKKNPSISAVSFWQPALDCTRCDERCHVVGQSCAVSWDTHIAARAMSARTVAPQATQAQYGVESYVSVVNGRRHKGFVWKSR